MSIHMRQQGNRVILDLSGDMTFSRRKEFPQAITDGLALKPQWLLCDLRNVISLDSSGLAMLISASEQCNNTSTQLGLICTEEKIKGLLRMAHLHNSVRFFASENETDTTPDGDPTSP